jgi:hypothetical protein
MVMPALLAKMEASAAGHLFRRNPDRSKLIILAQYDANESLWNLFTFTGTTIDFIIWKPVTWVAIGLHYFGYFYMHRYRVFCEEQPSDHCWADDFTSKFAIQSTDIAIFTTLVVFLFVAFCNMSFRYCFAQINHQLFFQ